MTASACCSINFNQDFSCLCVGTEQELKIFNVDPFGECFQLDTGTSVCEMLFSTSLVALVGVGNKPTTSPRRLKIINTKKRANICELTFPTAVLKIKLNRKRLVVVLVDQIYIYDISCLKLLHTIETSPNEVALCDLSSNDDSILIYPSPGPNVASPFHDNTNSVKKNSNESEIGTVILFDALNITPLNIIKAHKTELASISLNNNGTLFASASSKGTIIRVFNAMTGDKVYEFRRGSYTTVIRGLTFNLNSSLLAATSDTETVHVFKLAKDEDISQKNYISHDEDEINRVNNHEASQSNDFDPDREEHLIPKSFKVDEVIEPKIQPSITGKLFKNLPKNLSSILEPTRDFAFLKIPNHNREKNVIGFNGKNILVASVNGSLYVHSIPEKGGECVLIKQYQLE